MPSTATKPQRPAAQETEPEAPVAEVERVPVDALVDYTVVVNAITYRVGPGKDEVLRFPRSARLELYPSDARTRSLLSSRSIVPTAEASTVSTARQVFALWGANEDPAAPPLQEIQPVVPTNTPGAPINEE